MMTLTQQELLLDPTHNVFLNETDPLDTIFKPRSVALIGATEKEGSVGRTILWNLLSSPFGGAIYPINPKRNNILGVTAYPSVAAVDDEIDLAVIVTPAKLVPGLIDECVAKGIKGAIIISAGFKEIGPEGALLEEQIKEKAKKGNMRIVGPNCLGVMNPISGLNATFAAGVANKGSIGFISQSGALGTAVLDWSFEANVGFSFFASIGSMLDIQWSDLIYYLGADPNTKSIVIYMESIGEPRAFLSAAREVSLKKPIIVIKPGRTEGAAKAAASHTGSMAGSDVILDAAFRRCGVLRVNTIEELFSMSDVLGKQPAPQGPNLSIVTNAGGPGVIATDALLSTGGALAELHPETLKALNELLPSQWSHNNPIDVLGDASPALYAKALEIAAQDPGCDGLLVILTPQAMSDPTTTAQYVAEAAKNITKPILASWMGGREVAEGREILTKAGIPMFAHPDAAVTAFSYMVTYARNLKMLYEVPSMAPTIQLDTTHRQKAVEIIQAAQKSGRKILTEWESKSLLAAYGIETTQTEIATSVNEAIKAADSIGYPVVLKLHSETITHKTDVGGVQLNLASAEQVKKAFETIQKTVAQKASAKDFLGVTVQPMMKLDGIELIAGSSIDPQFGQVMLFGAGGQNVEIFQDISHALPPLNATLARRMMERTKIYKAFGGFRGKPAINMDKLESLLIQFSQLIIEQPLIAEIEMNPILAGAEQSIALDARIILQDLDVDSALLPRPAIRPYPEQYISEVIAKNKKAYRIRPIRTEDEPSMEAFHKSLSDETTSFVYGQPVDFNTRTAHERLSRVCFNDYDREIALVLESQNAAGEYSDIVGIARLSRRYGVDQEARFRMLLADSVQGVGLGKALLNALIDVAAQEDIKVIKGQLSQSNFKMRKMCQEFGFSIEESDTESDIFVKRLV